MKSHTPISQSSARKPQNGPGRPAAGESLTPQDVAEAAFALIVGEGEEALTMRRLGEMLGVRAMALYNHFPDKDAILDAVAHLALTRVPVPADKGPWKARIRAICHGIRSMAKQHPKVFRVAMSRRHPPDAALSQIALAMSALTDAGVAPAMQPVAYNTIRLYVRAFCLWEIEELETTGGQSAVKPAVKSGEAGGSGPSAAAAKNCVMVHDLDRQFEAGLDLILRGIQGGK